jgi:Uma2 family endonuclease
MSEPETRTRRWKRVEYDCLIELGFFRPGDPVELLGGHLIVAEPQGSGHFAAVRAAEEALRAAFGRGWEVRGQDPLALDDDSEPEPDLAVVPGSFRDYRTGHPSRPVLVVEVSESSLTLDRAHKGSLYARAGLADYWIVNLPERALELYRDPEPDPAAPFGWRYRSVTVLARGASVSPLTLPARRIPIAGLLL